MNMQTLRLHLIEVKLTGSKLGFSLGAYGILIVAILLWVIWLPHVKVEQEIQARTLSHLQTAVQMSKDSPREFPYSKNEERLDAFSRNLGQQRYVEQQIRTLFIIASNLGLKLRQGDYRRQWHAAGQFYEYQVDLPLLGSYQAIRQFCDRTLYTIPFSSLGQISFKRTEIRNPIVEAKVTLSLYVAAEKVGEMGTR
jgi:hypothetical protein